MHRIVVQAVAYFDEEHFDLARLPPEPLHERPLADGRQALHEDQPKEPDALFPLPAVAGPAADGDLVAHLGDVLEALGAQEVRDAGYGELVEAQTGQAFVHPVAEVAKGVRCGGGQGVVVGVGPVHHFLEFDVAAWF